DRVRVRHVEARQNLTLQALHGLCLFVRFMIVAQKMQKTMHREVSEVVVETYPLGSRFARCCLVGNHHVAEKPGPGRAMRPVVTRKRQHIGRLVASAPLPVHGRVKAGIASSLVSTMASSEGALPSVSTSAGVAAALIARRNAGFTPGTAFHCGSSTMMSRAGRRFIHCSRPRPRAGARWPGRK